MLPSSELAAASCSWRPMSVSACAVLAMSAIAAQQKESFLKSAGEGGGFTGFHGDAAEVEGSAEGALDGGLEEVEFAH